MDLVHGHWSVRMAAIVGLLFLSAPAEAEVSLDPTFGVNGVVRTAFGSGNSDTPRDLLIQPDGKILTAGISVAYSGEYFVAITRHSADGVPDSAGFGIDGKVYVRWVMRDQANAIDLQEDGKIVAAGMQAVSNATSAQIESVYRFHADGTVDSTFGGSGCIAIRPLLGSSEHAGVKVRADGGILAGGRQNGGGTTAFHVRRYLPDGTLAMGNFLDFGIDYNRGACAFPNDGGILLANIAPLNGRREFVLARVDSLGNPDAGFGANGIVQTGIEAVFNTSLRVLVLSDGKILLAGTTPRGAGQPSKWTVLRFYSNGTLDTLFGTNGRTDVAFLGDGINELCEDAVVGADGKILLAGQASGGLPGLARLLPDGGVDSTFSGDGKFTVNLNGGGGTHYLTGVQILSDGRILAAGFDFVSNGGDFSLARFYPSDPSSGIDAAEASPSRMLIHASPNPSHGETTVRLQLPREEAVCVEIFDLAGRGVRRVFDGTLSPGAHVIPWDGRDEAGRETSAGVYFTRVSTDEEIRTTRLIRLR